MGAGFLRMGAGFLRMGAGLRMGADVKVGGRKGGGRA
jgi:hypothetical protein